MFCAWSWLASQRPNFLCLDVTQISYFRWMLATFLFAFGQSLNVAIYKAIGTKGVYYGYKLGYFIPWRTGARLDSKIPLLLSVKNRLFNSRLVQLNAVSGPSDGQVAVLG